MRTQQVETASVTECTDAINRQADVVILTALRSVTMIRIVVGVAVIASHLLSATTGRSIKSMNADAKRL